MLRAMYAGVSGLKVHQTRLDVIGNNIANVNTIAFKSSRVTFKEMLSQTLEGARAPQGDLGGVNPKQVGLGVQLGSIDINMLQGNLQPTGVGTDLAIDGDGFFIVSNGQQDFYTRVGSLDIDENGNLINTTNGYILKGWMADPITGEINNQSDISPIVLSNLYQDIQGQASTEAIFSGNLNSSWPDNFDPASPNWSAVTPPSFTTSMDIYDSQGEVHTITLDFEMVNPDSDGDGVIDTLNTWQWTASVSDGTIIGSNSGQVTFDSNGNFTGTNGLLEFIPAGGASAGGNQTVTLDFTSLTQRAKISDVKGVGTDGYQSGTLESIYFDSSGTIVGSYTNGRVKNIGQIALAVFANPEGLRKIGGSLFAASANSGEFTSGYVPGQNGAGEISPGNLEMSNVDLAEQFTDMITAQRGFQANSKIISVSDQILQELVNLKR